MLLLIISFGIFLFISLQINRYFKYKSLLDWCLGVFLLIFSLIVFTMTVAGLFFRMNNPGFIFLLQIILLIISTLIVHYRTTPGQPILPFKLPPFDLKKLSKSYLVLAFIIISAAVAILNLVYVFFVPPNNNDSLMIHLARLGMWDQFGSWLPWNTKVFWQLTFPFNAEIVSYWTLLFTRSERLLGLITYISGYFSIILLYRLSLELTNKKTIAVISALTWAALPVVQLNFTSTRHDHVSSLLVLSAIYFFYFHLKEKNNGYLILSGLSIGLSIGTNYSVAGYLPGLAIAFVLFWLFFKKLAFREVITLGVSSMIAFFLFSSPIFISNKVSFSSFLGPDALEMTSQSAFQSESTTIEHLALMSVRWAYQIADFQGIPEPYLGKLMQYKAWLPAQIVEQTGISLEVNKSLLNQHVFRYVDHIPFSEDSSWFGIVGIFIFFVVSIYVIVNAIRKKHPLMLITTIFLLTVPLSFAFLRSGWTPYDGRYFITLFACLSIGLAALLDNLKSKLSNFLIFFIIVLSVLTLFMSIYSNPAKSFWGYKAFWIQHRFDSISAQSYDTKEMLYLVDQTVPEDGVLGIATTSTVYYEYGLFGEKFTRKIVPIFPDEKVCDNYWLKENAIQFILVDAGEPDYPPCSLGRYEALKSMKNWIVFEIK
jgi:hypothetical protein